MRTDKKAGFYADLTVGFKKDQQIKTEIVLYKYGKVYFPNNDYYNSDPLPIEWLELIESHETLKLMFDSNKEYTDMQAKLITEQRQTDPNWIAMTTSRRSSVTRRKSILDDSKMATAVNKYQQNNESPQPMTSYVSESDNKFTPNPNALMQAKKYQYVNFLNISNF